MEIDSDSVLMSKALASLPLQPQISSFDLLSK